MAWIMTLPSGEAVDSDDFTLDDLMAVEQETDTPWSILNPLKEVRIAKAFLRVAYRHTGADPDAVDALTLKQMKNVFDFRADEPFPGSEDGDSDPLGGKRADGSSPGASAGSSGSRRKRAASASGTSGS